VSHRTLDEHVPSDVVGCPACIDPPFIAEAAGPDRTAREVRHGASAQRGVWLRLHQRVLRRQAIRLADVVRVHAREIHAAGFSASALERRDDARGLLTQDPNAPVASAPTGEDVRRGVTRAVVDHDGLEVRERLRFEGPHGLIQVLRRVADGKQDRDGRRGAHGAPAATWAGCAR
jgi:hypothetical protein